MIATLRRLRAEVLGLNRRNHGYLFAHNPRARFALVDDKRATKTVLARAGLPVPTLRHVCESQGAVRALGAALLGAREFVLKPARGTGGAGIVVVVGREGEHFVKASGERLRRADLEAHACDVLAGSFSARAVPDVLLVEDRVVTHPVLAAVAHRGVPDVRVLVFRGVPAMAMLRLPTTRSDGRANLHLGGVGVGIDLPSGRTTEAVVGRRPVTRHPDLGVPLAGIGVPTWEETLRLAVESADAFGLGFVGVDLVHDAHRGPLVLELNARPGLAIQLANRRGLRPVLEAIAGAMLPEAAGARVALGCRYASGSGSSR